MAQLEARRTGHSVAHYEEAEDEERSTLSAPKSTKMGLGARLSRLLPGAGAKSTKSSSVAATEGSRSHHHAYGKVRFSVVLKVASNTIVNKVTKI